MGDIDRLRNDFKNQDNKSNHNGNLILGNIEEIDDNQETDDIRFKDQQNGDSSGTHKQNPNQRISQLQSSDSKKGDEECPSRNKKNFLAQQNNDSKWLKHIDICQNRDDLFEISKDDFNTLFDITPPESLYDKGMVDNNLTKDQKAVLNELYEFSAYLKRDINEESRLLKYELDFFQNDMKGTDSDESFSIEEDADKDKKGVDGNKIKNEEELDDDIEDQDDVEDMDEYDHDGNKKEKKKPKKLKKKKDTDREEKTNSEKNFVKKKKDESDSDDNDESSYGGTPKKEDLNAKVDDGEDGDDPKAKVQSRLSRNSIIFSSSNRNVGDLDFY